MAAERLRYDVFVAELGGDGPLVDHVGHRERDRFDPYATHFLLRDLSQVHDRQVVGVYRVMTQEAACAAGGFYCDGEFDLTPLRESGQNLLELGRSCLHPDYRGGPGLMHLWAAIAAFVAGRDITLLFGVASFHGTDVNLFAGALSLLHQRHLAPPPLRVVPRGPNALRMDQIAADHIDRVAAMRETPALIKAYLRLGGVVGDGAYVDHAFNTTDICLILPTAAVGAFQRSTLEKMQQHG
ncbi:ornithine-acyl[acyl carrier protein] N-acyltransferase [Yoonia sediminilitoris]|uniref:L-ornithine N(alpha)-acyltransferase n=2 Tax=Yoonia sediminilitoris TaxID=1286148 RepID=A0A2T6KCT1_9RHOB|nr:ornithine-acyl[acyl carrier protein] N-acyltransferase [Yoonia sediminilitoris]RCW94187.1 ornithine-acyl[acyl carrier protein] N-acyltransferase [Yoonia sediminilitoris]